MEISSIKLVRNVLATSVTILTAQSRIKHIRPLLLTFNKDSVGSIAWDQTPTNFLFDLNKELSRKLSEENYNLFFYQLAIICLEEEYADEIKSDIEALIAKVFPD